MADNVARPWNEKWSDLTITCDSQNFKVHKVILCAASPVIAAACDIDMKEAKTGIIEHTEFDAETVKRMITYAYTKGYEVTEVPGNENNTKSLDKVNAEIDKTEPAESEILPDLALLRVTASVAWLAALRAHTRVYGLAEYYGISELKTLATEKFAALFKAHWDSQSRDDVVELLGVVQEVCTISSRGDELQSTLLSLMVKHVDDLATIPEFVTALGEQEGSSTFTADLLGAFGHNVVGLIAQHGQECQEANAKIVELTNALAEAKTADARKDMVVGYKLKTAQEEQEHTEEVMYTLITDLGELPSGCRNGNCDATFGRLDFERKGYYGRAKCGDWQIRCGNILGRRRCGCRLN
jgi:hypothetical protein